MLTQKMIYQVIYNQTAHLEENCPTKY